MNAYSVIIFQRAARRLAARDRLGVVTRLGRLAAATVEARCLPGFQVRVGSGCGRGREGRDGKEQG